MPNSKPYAWTVLSLSILVSVGVGCNDLREAVSSTSTETAVVEETCDATAIPFGGGDGTSLKPYLICSVAQLNEVVNLTLSYKLKADLDLTTGFTPLGSYTTGFSGTFDGDQHTLSNWTYAAANPGDAAGTIQAGTTHADYAVGFFRALESGAVVKNLTLSNVSIKGRYFTGGMVGLMKSGSTVQNVHVTTSGLVADLSTATTGIIIGFNDIPTAGGATGKTAGVVGEMQANSTLTGSSFSGLVRGAMHVGGVVGNTEGVVSNSHSSGAIKGRDGNSGGFAGNIGGTGSSISGSYSTATVLDIAGNSGGFIGSVNAGGLVTKSYYNGSMTGAALGIGGFVGYVIGTDAKITKCYSAGSVVGSSGSSYAGGFAGWVKDGGSIEDSYSTSTVSSASWAAGFVAVVSYTNSYGTISRVYSTGSVSSTSVYFADLVGYLGAGGVVNNSYAIDTASSNTEVHTIVAASAPYNIGTMNASTSVAAATLQNSANFTGWDFTTVWAIDPAVNGGYPTLR